MTSFFISNAYAEGAAVQPSAGIMDFLPLIGLVAVFYFLVMRPQMKRAKEMKVMMAALQKGDEIVTTGGVMGRVSKVADSYISVEVAEGINLNIQKAAIQNVLPKGTLKSMS
jgi:preprotein translocase subunit YajC